MVFLDHFIKKHLENAPPTPSLAPPTPSSPAPPTPSTPAPTTPSSLAPTTPSSLAPTTPSTPSSPAPPTPSLPAPPTSFVPSPCIHPDPAIPSMILCCGDVEQNPGPDFKCLHEMCAVSTTLYTSLCELACHITSVHVVDLVCSWDGCVFGVHQADAREMETHMLRHIYMTHIFSTFDEWCEALPWGYADESTDLRLCPPSLRCNFDLLLLDETFDIRKRYTVIDHHMYLFHLRRDHPEQYFEKVERFIARQPPGKWIFNVFPSHVEYTKTGKVQKKAYGCSSWF